MKWTSQEVTLLLRWPVTEVPVLMDLSGTLQLSWEHLDDSRAGIGIELTEAYVRPDLACEEGGTLQVLLRCECREPNEDEPSESAAIG